MTQFLQAYGIWIVLGIVLLFLLVRLTRSGGHHSQAGQGPGGQSEQAGNQTGRTGQYDGEHRHGGGCC